MSCPHDFALERLPVLDHGYVRFLNDMGDDLEVANDAKVSFLKESSSYGRAEERIVNFLGREDHTSPFRQSVMKFEVYAPLMVCRQWWKYIIGSDHAEAPLAPPTGHVAHNESSRRYVTESIELYIPAADAWRSAPENAKQGSGAMLPLEIGSELTEMLIATYDECVARYERAIELGVAVEQARLFLPAYGLYVRWRWMASLQGVCHFLSQRLAHDAQREIYEYAVALRQIADEHFPHAVRAYLKEFAPAPEA